jgi:hypothetical protein
MSVRQRVSFLERQTRMANTGPKWQIVRVGNDDAPPEPGLWDFRESELPTRIPGTQLFLMDFRMDRSRPLKFRNVSGNKAT